MPGAFRAKWYGEDHMGSLYSHNLYHAQHFTLGRDSWPIFSHIPKPPPKNMVFLARIGFSAPRDTMVVLLSRNTYNVVVNYFTIYTPMKSSVDVEYRPSNHPKMTWSFFFLFFLRFFRFFALFRDHYLTEEKEFLLMLHTEIFSNVLRNKMQWQDRHRLCASWRNGFMSKHHVFWGWFGDVGENWPWSSTQCEVLGMIQIVWIQWSHVIFTISFRSERSRHWALTMPEKNL